MFATLCVSPYGPLLIYLVWYALSCFRMCLYQAFLPCEKNKEIKTQAENSNFGHLFKDRIKSCYLWFRTSSQLSFNFPKKLCNHVMFATFKVWCTLLMSALLSKYDKAGVIQRLQSNQVNKVTKCPLPKTIPSYKGYEVSKATKCPLPKNNNDFHYKTQPLRGW